jgi:hypothetical protein
MSEHIQPAPNSLAPTAPAAPEEHERTPGVAHEREIFNFRLIVRVGVGLIVTAAVIHIAVWLLLVYDKNYKAPPLEGKSALALADARRPLAERLDNVPQPHLEGIERESSLLVLRRENGDEQRFYTGADVPVRIAGRDGQLRNARLFELREGQTVSVCYHMPGGLEGVYGVVTAVVSPPEKEAKKIANELADADQTLIGTVVRLEPRSVAAAREWAEVQMDRYGWADRNKGVARIPVSTAMEQVLRSKEFRPSDKKKSDGRIAPPGRSNSGRGPSGGNAR